jgi:hypothetical protein
MAYLKDFNNGSNLAAFTKRLCENMAQKGSAMIDEYMHLSADVNFPCVLS